VLSRSGGERAAVGNGWSKWIIPKDE